MPRVTKKEKSEKKNRVLDLKFTKNYTQELHSEEVQTPAQRKMGDLVKQMVFYHWSREKGYEVVPDAPELFKKQFRNIVSLLYDDKRAEVVLPDEFWSALRCINQENFWKFEEKDTPVLKPFLCQFLTYLGRENVENHAGFLQHLSPHCQDDKDIVFLMCKVNLWHLQYASKRLLSNPSFVRKAFEEGQPGRNDIHDELVVQITAKLDLQEKGAFWEHFPEWLWRHGQILNATGFKKKIIDNLKFGSPFDGTKHYDKKLAGPNGTARLQYQQNETSQGREKGFFIDHVQPVTGPLINGVLQPKQFILYCVQRDLHKGFRYEKVKGTRACSVEAVKTLLRKYPERIPDDLILHCIVLPKWFELFD